MTESGFKVPADLADTDLSLTQVRSIVTIRRKAKGIQNRIDALPGKKAALEGELETLRTREAAIKAGQTDPALLPDPEPAPGEVEPFPEG